MNEALTPNIVRPMNVKLDIEPHWNWKRAIPAPGHTEVDFERRVDFRGMVRFSPALSGDIAGAVREIRLLFNKNNELEIPFTLSGQMPNVRPRPDASFLTKSLQRGLLQKGAEELQEQLFGPRERRAPNDRQPDQERQQKPSSPEDLIRRGLEGLFGRQKR